MLKGCIGFNLIMNPIVASLLEFNEAFEIPKLEELVDCLKICSEPSNELRRSLRFFNSW